jgi:hypothetical protein
MYCKVKWMSAADVSYHRITSWHSLARSQESYDEYSDSDVSLHIRYVTL